MSEATTPYLITYTRSVCVSCNVQIPSEVIAGLSPAEADGAVYDYIFEKGLGGAEFDEEDLGMDDDSLVVEGPVQP
jgi:hypothetical protein